jgi:NitT/TauT family transport system substrate-binding protein
MGTWYRLKDPSDVRLLSALVALVALLLGHPLPAEQPLRIGTNIWPGYEPLYLAAEREDWAGRLDARLVEYPSATEVLRAFRNEALEGAALTLDEVLVLREAELPLKVVLVLDISAGGDVILARAGPERLEDLRGHRIGVESGALGAYVLTRALEMHGLGLDDVHIVHLDISQQERAYLRGEIDAVVTFDPVRRRLLATGARELFTSNEIPGEIVDVLVIHERVWQSERHRLAEIVAGWFRALRHVAEQPVLAANFIARRLQVPPDEVLESYAGMRLPGVAENARLLDGELAITLERLQRTLVRERLLRQVQDNSQLLDAGLLPDTEHASL